MTNERLYLATDLPMVFNTAVSWALWLNLRSSMNDRFNAVTDRFVSIDQRFDDKRDLWRAELYRVEEVLDARLKHLEER
jgi:hypothetical protein